jgi:hypothetical protein
VTGFNISHVGNSLMTWRLPAKRQRFVDCVKVLLDVVKESSEWCVPLKPALGGVNALIRHYEVPVEWMAVTHNVHEPSQLFERLREKIEDLILHLNRFTRNVNTAMASRD